MSDSVVYILLGYKNWADINVLRDIELHESSKVTSNVRYQEYNDNGRENNKKVGSNLLSYYSTFDLIGIMNKLVVSIIAGSISSSGCYSIIVGSTYDGSKKKATAVLARYVQHSYDGDGNNSAKPQEHLLSVFTNGCTTGENYRVM